MYNKAVNRICKKKRSNKAMNKRQLEILKLLHNKKEFITFAEIANQSDVSVKTVRNDVGAIKEYLSLQKVGSIETKPHTGIRLIISDDEWRGLDFQTDDTEKEILFFILTHLMKNGSLTAQHLAEQYYMSRTQLEAVLQRAGEWFFENRIFFERKRGRGIFIKCSEFNKRLALLNLYKENISEYSKKISLREPMHALLNAEEYTAMCAALNGFDADILAKAILETEDEFGLILNADSAVNFLFLTSLCVLQIKKGITVEMPKTVSVFNETAFEKEFSLSLAKKIENIYKISICKEELGFIVFALEISEIRQFSSTDARRRFEADNILLCRLTVKAVNLISEITGVDLREDRFFVKQMFLQLKVSIARLKYAVVCKNNLLPQIKTKYPNMMATAWFLGNIFEKELHMEINEHEVGFLALHIGGAIERQLSSVCACIVCDYGIGISQILKEKIIRHIPEIRITSVFSARDIRLIKNESCDFVISATSLDGYRINKDIIRVGNLLDESDIKRLEDYTKKIRLKRKDVFKSIVPSTSLFNEELIFLNVDCADKNELLYMMCSKLESLGYVTESFEKSVTEREKSTSTDIGKGFAIPHGLGKYVNHSATAFASLKTPIEWNENGETVDMVFLVAFDMDESESTKEEIFRFYKSIVSFMEDENECERLRRFTDIKDALKIFKLW